MARRSLNRLTARQVFSLGPGKHSDGGGLYLYKDEGGRASWVFRWTRESRRREMGLGAAHRGGVDIKDARQAAIAARVLVTGGGDPIAAREAAPAAPVVVPTFGEVANAFVAAQGPQWRNDKHRAQWKMTLTRYAAPLRSRPVDQVDTAAVLEVLRPIWLAKPETASRLRGRIERVLDAARAEGHRSGENPARWRGHLDLLLAKRQKLSRGHHAAMAWSEVPAFVARLRKADPTSALALEFAILTAARTGEAIGARWSEIDLSGKVWTIPAARMKASREHRVPLSEPALAVLERATLLTEGKADNPVFPAPGGRKPLSNMAMAMLLKRMGAGGVTVHGFRSSFRDWAAETTSFPREIIESSLAHTVGDATERAYWRGDVLERRRKLMAAWSAYLARSEGGQVVQLAARA